MKIVKKVKNIFKKIFGGIDLTWKKLIIFAVCAGVYTAVMSLIPATYDTSFRDIAINLEWWILMGIIIITNCKSPKESALKCFVFFLISQPLVYLIQVPFNDMGFGLFKFYRYWFIVTLLTIPMGFIGYYINKKNILSVIILLPMLLLLSYLGLDYLDATVDNFPHHLLSFISCYGIIVVVVLCLFKDLRNKLILFGVTLLVTVGLLVFRGGISNGEYDLYRELDVTFESKPYIEYFTATGKGEVTIVDAEEGPYTVRLNGRKREIYEFDITDGINSYHFKYYFDKSNNTVILEQTNNEEEATNE